MKGRWPGAILSAVALLVAAPVLAAIAAAIWMEDRRPVLFRQTRVGQHFRRFEIWKFRTMAAGGAGSAVTARSDRRITRVGRVLRRWKLDELPQLVNVLRGEMALIGPRPEVPEFVDERDPRWRTVLAVRPGMVNGVSWRFRNEQEMLGRFADPDRGYREAILPEKLRLNCASIERQRGRKK